MRIRSLSLEDGLYLLFFSLALGLRLFNLGAAPLTDAEANWALQALDLARGEQPHIGPQAAYVLLTSLSFTLFKATNFLARLLPALAGGLLALLPALLRPLLGKTSRLRWSGLALALGLAVDPGLVAVSHTAGSLMPALVFSALALALFARRKMVWAGIAAGLALLSGPALLHGLLIMALGWGAYRLVEKRFKLPSQNEAGASTWNLPPLARSGWRAGGLALAGTLLFAGLLFFRAPQGLGALAATLPEYLLSWVRPSGIPALRLPAALLVYQPLVVILALMAAWRGWKTLHEGDAAGRLAIGLSLWALVGLVITMLYPARQVGDLGWALLPLWALAALELPHHLPGREGRPVRLAAAGLAALLCILAVIIWVNVLSIGRYQVELSMYWLVMGGVALLGMISVVMVAAGWSLVSARLGVMWSASAVLGIAMLSALWGLAYLRPQSAQELWNTPPAAGLADQLVETLVELSQLTTGHDTEIEIALLDDSPALRWALRQFPNLSRADGLAATDAPPIVITNQAQQTPALAQQYRGQDLVWRIYPGWESVLPPNMAAWLAFRQAPQVTQQIILWARADVFPGGLDALSNEMQPAAP